MTEFEKVLGIFCLAVVPSGWIGFTAVYSHSMFVILGVSFILFSPAIVLAIEFILVHRQHRGHPLHPTHAAMLVRVWFDETLIALRVFLWEQAFRARSEPDNFPTVSGKRPVLLIHGYMCNRGFWNSWMRRLRYGGVPYCAVTLEPAFGSIDDGIDALELAVREVTLATGLAPLILAHSMGGLKVRAWMRKYPTEARAHHVVTIASPHKGTWLARYGISRNARQVRIGSTWLEDLSRSEPRSRYRRFTCFYGHCDNVVFPMERATLPGADNRHLEAAAHIQMALRDEVFQEVMRLLDMQHVYG